MLRTALLALGALLVVAPGRPATEVGRALDRELHGLVPSGRTLRLLVETDRPDAVQARVLALGGTVARRLERAGALVASVPDTSLPALAADAAVKRIHPDRPVRGAMQRAGAAVGARWVRENLGLDGAGIGVATIDSGVAPHDDLAGRIAHFVDFVDAQTAPHDGFGHGTHVAGIIGGSGRDSNGARRGIAPGVHLVVLRALDRYGEGYISSAIAALDYAVAHRAEFNIRVINLSVAAGVYESYRTDPLTLAAARAVEAGIVVVTAAGNLGRNADGQRQYGGITAPGNAPWVLTVGAASHNGTIDRADDTVAPFSSVGPTAIDGLAKPDLVAPGLGIESLADPDSTLFTSRPQARVWGTEQTLAEPYISLSGSSMAAPMVAGTAALILQADPALTPAAVKAILRTSAERHEDESDLAQGAGFLNARTAVALVRTLAADAGARRRFERLVRRASAAESRIASCAAGGASCGYPMVLEQCAPACFNELAGAVVGVAAPARDSILWPPRPPRWVQ